MSIPTRANPKNGRFDLKSHQILLVILIILTATSISIVLIQLIRNKQTFDDLLNSLSMEILGAALTFYSLDLLIRPVKHREYFNSRKTKLIKDMSSRVNSVAMVAVDELREMGLLADGSLRGIDFGGADLQSSMLWNADLEKVKLMKANLRSANLKGANLCGANLYETHLEQADLREVNLRDVRHISTVSFDKQTVLPNGDQWRESYDMTRFVNPGHADFWEPYRIRKQRRREGQ